MVGGWSWGLCRLCENAVQSLPNRAMAHKRLVPDKLGEKHAVRPCNSWGPVRHGACRKARRGGQCPAPLLIQMPLRSAERLTSVLHARRASRA